MNDPGRITPELHNALEIWVEIIFGDDSVRPKLNCEYLREKPAKEVLVGDGPHPVNSVWVHETFSEMVRNGTRDIFEKGPTDAEIPSKELREAWRSAKATEPVNYIDSSLFLHYTHDVKTEVFEVLSILMDTTPERIHDPQLKSEFEMFDERMIFTLSRSSDNEHPIHPYAWAAPRFLQYSGLKPVDMLSRLEAIPSSELKVVTLVDPLQ